MHHCCLSKDLRSREVKDRKGVWRDKKGAPGRRITIGGAKKKVEKGKKNREGEKEGIFSIWVVLSNVQ